MKNPLVSIIIPTYNRAHLIGETLDSVFEQTYQNWECIVIDDGSIDETDIVINAYCEKDPRFRYYLRPDKYLSGGNGARNFGFTLTNGKYLQWLDSDDLLKSTKIEKQIKLLEESNEINLCLCDVLIFDKDTFYKKNKKLIPSHNLFAEYATKKISIGTNQPLWLKSYLDTQKLYDEEVVRGQDYDFFVRMFSKEDLKYIVIPENLVLVRSSSSDNRITNEFKKKYKSKEMRSYLTGYIYAYKLLSRKDSESYYIEILNILLKKIKIIIQNRDFYTAQDIINNLSNNLYAGNKLKYKFFFIRLKFLIFLLKISDLKGYGRFKHYLQIS